MFGLKTASILLGFGHRTQAPRGLTQIFEVISVPNKFGRTPIV